MNGDTQIGGPQPGFPATQLSAVRAAGDASPEVRRAALARIVEGYWKPVYKHIRRKWNAANEQAKDWTQGFFAEALDRELFARFDPARAAFRTYLRTCVDGYVANARTAESRLKRGGGQPVLTLDFDAAEEELRHTRGTADDAAAAFDRDWDRQVLDRALRLLQERCAADGRLRCYEVFARYELFEDGGGRPTYAAIAAALGVPATTVTNDLAAARRIFRGLVLATLRELTADEQEFRAEARRLLGDDAA
jgi:RNA polymerase sigma factor (sigma-70 family)